VAKVRRLDVLLGSSWALAEAKKTILDDTASPEARKAALQSLLDARAPELRQIAEKMLAVQSVNAVAATALATFNDPAIGPMLVDAYPKFDAKDRPKLIAALASRASFASVLLDAVASGKFQRTDISATDARQIRNLNDAALTKRLGEIWGDVRDTPGEKLKLLAAYKAELTTAAAGARAGRAGGFGRGRAGNPAQAAGGMPPALRQADRSAGRQIFAKTCAVCHTLFGEGGKVGPDLTGGQKRKDIDMLLGKVVDPSSELPLESRVTVVLLKDGQTQSGIVVNRTANTMTLRTVAEPITVSMADVVRTQLSNVSLMPEGLLETMDATQRRNLIAYLMGEEQAPLPAGPQGP